MFLSIVIEGDALGSVSGGQQKRFMFHGNSITPGRDPLVTLSAGSSSPFHSPRALPQSAERGGAPLLFRRFVSPPVGPPEKPGQRGYGPCVEPPLSGLFVFIKIND